MHQFVSRILKLLPAALLPILPCFADFSFKLNDLVTFSKTSQTIEHLDHDDFEGTAATTDWIANREFVTYLIQPELIWMNKEFYVKAVGTYGWVLTGNVCKYPLGWHGNGNTKGLDLEVGYMMDICKRFTFIPFIGFVYNIAYVESNHQHLLHNNPDSFLSQNGTRSYTTLYYPYIGIEFDFKTHIWEKHDLQCFLSYQFGYGGGHGRTRVPHTFITDNPATSRYGSNTKYRNIISNEVEIGAFFAVDKYWQIGLELDYLVSYNARKLPLKLQHNKKIVKAGQYTPSQYHRVSDYTSQAFSVIFSVIYSFSGKGGTIVR